MRATRIYPVSVTLVCLLLVLSTGCESEQPATGLEAWPATSGGLVNDPGIEARVDSLIAVMSVEELVGQTIQADINSISPADIVDYPLGSVLNGGNSAPGADNHAPATAWLELADEYWNVSTTRGGTEIPIIWGTDAVHGHNNIVGATIFPHNIGLGATRNAELMRKIGAITAKEIRITGQDWTFAPTLAVVRDDRWGRTYEGYSEDPEIVADFASAMIEGIQGSINETGMFAETQMIATAKHFLGDGGTELGKDQGDNIASEADLARIHAAGYAPAIDAGVQVIMASFNSWHGKKLHGHQYLLTDVLKGRMGFNGFIVGDWNGHGQVDGCSATSCAASLNAGVDMFMAPDSWKDLYHNTLDDVNQGRISRARLEDAVRRILRVKIRSGLLDRGAPSGRMYAGEFDKLGAPESIEVARQAVRESLVLLKNNGGVLPINPASNVLVAGDGADNIAKASGGWTLTWQGDGNTNADFPGAQSIWDGIRSSVEAAGGTAMLSEDGNYSTTPDVAIVVFGEDPYAEFIGDRDNVDYDSQTSDALPLLTKLKAAGIPTVSVFLSGRPLWVNPELNQSDAFVAAWLPGTQGSGVSDVLIANPDGSSNFDFKGKLSYSWPRTALQTPLNRGDENYDPLFPYGYGLTYADAQTLAQLSEDSGINTEENSPLVIFQDGKFANDGILEVRNDDAVARGNRQVLGLGESLRLRWVDRLAQEDAFHVTWNDSGSATLRILGTPTDFTRQSNGDMALAIDYKVDARTSGETNLQMECGPGCSGSVNITDQVNLAAEKGWSVANIKLSCFESAGADMSNITSPFGLSSTDALSIQISKIEIVPNQGNAICPGG